MVGLVIVSHSRALADALIALVKQVSINEIPLARAGGVGLKHQEFGTDAVEIVEAIHSVYSPDGVIVLMDLGSAILSAEMALEFLSDDMRPHIRICAAPVVEGAISAGVQIGLGGDLDTVYREAQQALFPKIEQLSVSDESVVPESPISTPSASEGEDTGKEIILTIRAKYGLHARLSARFVQTAAPFDAEVWVSKLLPLQDSPSAEGREGAEGKREVAKGPVPATSLNSLTTLGVLQGEQIAVFAQGKDTDQVLAALQNQADQNFGENLSDYAEIPSVPVTEAASDQDEMDIIPISEGIAIGPAFHYQMTQMQIRDYETDNPDLEWKRLQNALEVVRQMIMQQRQHVEVQLGSTQAAIFDIQLLTLEDEAILETARTQIFQHHRNVESAWNKSITALANSYKTLSDPYLRQRANDVLDVGNQVLFALMGHTAATPTFPEPGILVASEIPSSLIAQLDSGQVLGLIAMRGGPTDHSSILARALGIPAIVVPSLQNFPSGTIIGIDGSNGNLWIDPPPQTLKKVKKCQHKWLTQRERLVGACHEPAVTRDGNHIRIAANAMSITDAKTAIRNGAEAIGLLRTEFLYLTRSTAPSEAEQVEMLSQISGFMGNYPVYVRTLDVGGDKTIPYLELPKENNPFLGLRSIRFSLERPDLFHTQLRAILRASVGSDIRIMFPMISTMDEVTQVLQCLENAHQALEDEQVAHRWPLEVAMMIETPSAALLTPSLAKYADYFSIGTNDLTQYTLAAERGHPKLSQYADGLHPSVLFLIQYVTSAAHQRGKRVGVCGELARDPLAVPVLLGLGIDGLSLNPAGIPQIKDIIRKIDMESASALANKALQADSATEVRSMVKELIAQL